MIYCLNKLIKFSYLLLTKTIGSNNTDEETRKKIKLVFQLITCNFFFLIHNLQALIDVYIAEQKMIEKGINTVTIAPNRARIHSTSSNFC